MKKLTAEQAEFVYNELIKKMSVDQCVIRSVLEKCTEKQFPDFNMSIGETGYVKLLKGFDAILLESKIGAICINKRIFKQFATGVAAIAQWLEENE